MGSIKIAGVSIVRDKLNDIDYNVLVNQALKSNRYKNDKNALDNIRKELEANGIHDKHTEVVKVGDVGVTRHDRQRDTKRKKRVSKKDTL